MVNRTTCPVCEAEGGAIELPDANAVALRDALKLTFGEHTDAALSAFLCLECRIPYLVVWPEVCNPEKAQDMAGFLAERGPLMATEFFFWGAYLDDAGTLTIDVDRLADVMGFDPAEMNEALSAAVKESIPVDCAKDGVKRVVLTRRSRN